MQFLNLNHFGFLLTVCRLTLSTIKNNSLFFKKNSDESNVDAFKYMHKKENKSFKNHLYNYILQIVPINRL